MVKEEGWVCKVCRGLAKLATLSEIFGFRSDHRACCCLVCGRMALVGSLWPAYG